MDNPSLLPAGLINAYRETRYHVFTEPPIALAIDGFNGDVLALHRRFDVDCSAFVTACNPFSNAVSDAENQTLMQQLETELREARYRYVPGEGRHPSNAWPAEPSYLALGMAQQEAATIGRRFSQNAVVWTGCDGIPRLILLR